MLRPSVNEHLRDQSFGTETNLDIDELLIDLNVGFEQILSEFLLFSYSVEFLSLVISDY